MPVPGCAQKNFKIVAAGVRTTRRAPGTHGWSVPQVSWSHPFVERLIAAIRQEYLDRLFFWTADDLGRKLELFKSFYNPARVQQGLSGDTPGEKAGGPTPQPASLENYRWQSHCHGLFELPIAA